MRRRKIKKHPFQEDSLRWVVPYADFVTLLFGFFVMMYAVSSVNLQKYKSLSDSFDEIFSAKVKDKIEPTIKDINQSALMDDKTFELVQKQLQQQKDKKIKEMHDEFSNLAKDKMEVRKNEEWVEIDLKSKSLFKSGSANLNKKSIGLLKNIAGQLKKSNEYVVIEGHTDNRAIVSKRFPSNWELSATRAATVARVLVEHGVAPSKIFAIGYSDLYPLASNETARGRAKNRRVVFVISKSKSAQRFLDPQQQLTYALEKKKEEVSTVGKKAVVKTIKTKSGGIKFTRGLEDIDDKKKKESDKPQTGRAQEIEPLPIKPNSQNERIEIRGEEQ